MLLTYTDKCTLIPPVRHFAPRKFTVMTTQCNPDKVLNEMLYRAIQWRHKKAKSFDVVLFTHTDYYGLPEDHPTGYARACIRYYSTAREGMFKIPVDFVENWADHTVPLEVYASN